MLKGVRFRCQLAVAAGDAAGRVRPPAQRHAVVMNGDVRVVILSLRQARDAVYANAIAAAKSETGASRSSAPSTSSQPSGDSTSRVCRARLSAWRASASPSFWSGHPGEELELHARVVNPQFVRMLRAIGFDRRWARAEGAHLYDADGNRYLDWLGGFGMYNVGRNNPRVKAALLEAP